TSDRTYQCWCPGSPSAFSGRASALPWRLPAAHHAELSLLVRKSPYARFFLPHPKFLPDNLTQRANCVTLVTWPPHARQSLLRYLAQSASNCAFPAMGKGAVTGQ